MDAAQAELLKNELLGKELGGWIIVGFLGKGKSAVVMSATCDGIEAAVKVFHPELIERYGKSVQLERIMREKSLVGASHPNLVKIYGGGECSATGYLYVVMEKLAYSNLHEKLKDVPTGLIRQIISQVASAARFLEDRGLAHRDIKPENIAISTDFSRAVLLDLGVLRPIGNSDLTDVDQRLFIGTLRYSSPEYLARKEQDTFEGWRAVTFYQLGAVLHDLLMRSVLFEEYSEPFSILVDAVMTKVPEIYGADTLCVALAKHSLVKNPSTRIHLVNWERFQCVLSGEADVTSAARERINERQKYFQATAFEASHKELLADPSKPSRRALEEVCNRLESRIAALMNSLQSFPLRTTQSFKSLENGVTTTLIAFDKDDLKGISTRISVLIKIEFLDENAGSPIYKVSACSVMSEAEGNVESMGNTIEIYCGEIPEFLDGQYLEALFLGSLERSYQAMEQGACPVSAQVVTLIGEDVP